MVEEARESEEMRKLRPRERDPNMAFSASYWELHLGLTFLTSCPLIVFYALANELK
jgi:hypothetical protein